MFLIVLVKTWIPWTPVLDGIHDARMLAFKEEKNWSQRCVLRVYVSPGASRCLLFWVVILVGVIY